MVGMSDKYTISEIVGKMECHCGMTARDLCEQSKTKQRDITIGQAFGMIADGYAFFPLWGKVDGEKVMEYAFFGLKIAFVPFRDFRNFKKALEDYIGGSEEPDDVGEGLF